MTDYQTNAPRRPDGAKGIAGLRRMSTTAGVAGLGDYRAVSPAAVASAVSAAVSVAAVLHWAFLLAAVGAVGLGVVAVARIRRSHGTLTGTPVALLGVVAGAAVLATVGAGEVAARSAASGDDAGVRRAVSGFGDSIAAGDARSAYEDFTTVGFREAVPFGQFEANVTSFGRVLDRGTGEPVYGDLTATAAGPRVRLTANPDAGDDGLGDAAETEMVARFATGREARQPVLLRRTPAGWRIDQVPGWFPASADR